MMEFVKSEGSQSYTIPLDSVDLKYLSKYVRTPHADKRPLWTRKCLDGESEYCHVQIVTQDDNEDCYSEESFDTFNCHICNVEVPVLYFKKHNESEKHVSLKTIFQKVLERVSTQINMSVINNDKDIDEDVYYCVPCSKIIKIENKHRHESTQHHVKSQRGMNVVHEFNKIFEENKGYVGVKDVENKEILEYKRRNIGNDTINNIVNDVTNEDKSNNDETKTVCSTNYHTMTVHQPVGTVDHLGPKEKHDKELSTEENYFKDMVRKYNLEVNLPIVDGGFIHVASPSGVTVKISRDHFHSYLYVDKGRIIYCQICLTYVELGEESKHKVTEEHARNVFLPVNEQFARTLDENDSHCLICNAEVITSELSKHHQYDNYHVECFNCAKITDICRNNEILANGIDTENVERTHSNVNHVSNSEENKIKKCMNNKECISKVNLSENELGDHLNESGHIARTGVATSVQKLVFCKLCNVSVPQDQIEYHNAGTPHWSNAFKNICSGVADGLQAYFSKDNLKTDSDLSEKQNDILKNDNVAKENDITKNDNVAKQNDITKNDNVAKQNDISKNYKVAKQNDITKNDNVAKQNDITKNDDVAKQTDIPKNDNVAKQNDIPKNDNIAKQNDITKNDNVAKQNDITKNYDVAKQNYITKNDNVAKQNEAPKNDNVANTSVSNITNNEISIDSSPFRYADSTKNKITCIVCNVDIANVLQSITKHEASSNHNSSLQQFLKNHSIRKHPKRSFCECCRDINVTNIWAHICTERHTALLQLEFEVNSKLLKFHVYDSSIRNGKSFEVRELYERLLESNKIYKLPNSHFCCTFCELELSEKGDEIDHMFTEEHEKWLKMIYKSR